MAATRPDPFSLPIPMRPQMADLAAALGVSVATVSRAFHGSTLVSEATRDRVQALAKHWRYTVNLQAQHLRLGVNNTVALVIPYDPAAKQSVKDPFFLSMMGHIADALTDQGYDMLLSRVSVNDLQAVAALHHSGRVGGVVMIGQWSQHSGLNELHQRGLPLVVWGAKLPDQAYCSVGGNNVQGGRLAAAHVLGQGHRRLAFVGDVRLPEVSERHRGFMQAVTAAHAAEPSVVNAPFEPVLAAAALRQFVANQLAQAAAQRVQAVVCASDVLAVTLMQVARQNNWEVPRDLSVVGYDDVSVAAYSNPPLTTVAQPLERAAVALVERLKALMASEAASSCELDVELVQRQSCAAA